MDGELARDVAERLIQDFGFERRETPEGERLARGRCPSCGEREAFTPPGNPFIVICNRQNKCAARTLAKSLYPDLFGQFEKRSPATPEHPNATADAYLRSRAIDPARIAGWYTQARTTDPEEVRACKENPALPAPREYPTVRFTLSNGVEYHRLIDYTGRNKNKIMAAYRGAHWAPPGFDPAKHEGDLWIVEGVLDAVSLAIALPSPQGGEGPGVRAAQGVAVAASLSSTHVPTDLLEALRGRKVRVVIAQDADRAGRKGADKLADACKERGLPFDFAFSDDAKEDSARDWNDLLLTGDLDEDLREDTLDTALWRGRLHTAATAKAFYQVWREGDRPPGLFEFRGSYYIGRDAKAPGEDEGAEDDGADGDVKVRCISNFTLEPEVIVARRIAKGGSEHEFRAVVHNHRGSMTMTIAGKELTDTKAFKAALRTRGWAHWTGNATDLDRLVEHVEAKRPPKVHEISIVGWDKESDCYLFPNVAYDKSGRPVAPDDRGYFTIGRDWFHLNVSESEKAIPHAAPEHLPQALRLVLQAFGAPALLVIGFGAASLFTNQFAARPNTNFFPILSLYGPAGTGKTSILKILNRLLARDVQEGLALNAVDTAKGITRHIASVSNLPVALLELDQAKALRFDLNQLLTLFNRGPLQLRAMKSNDLATQEVKILGSLLFAQNDEQFQGEPQRSRVVSLGFMTLLEAGSERLAANKAVLAMPLGALAAFRHELLSRREAVQAELFRLYDEYEPLLGKRGIAHGRVAQCHAAVLAGAHLVAKTFLPEAEARAVIQDCLDETISVAQRKIASLYEESDFLSLFTGTVHDLILRDKLRDHSPDDREVWLHSGELVAALAEAHIHFNFEKVFAELNASGKVLFHGKAKYSARVAKSVRLTGYDAALFGFDRQAAGANASGF